MSSSHSSARAQLVSSDPFPSMEEQNRRRLLEACVQAVGQHGLQALQMNHVIVASGLSRRTVYKYFKNKAEIVHAAYLQEGARLFAGAQREISQCKRVEDIFVQSFLYVIQELPKSSLLSALIHDHQGLLENLQVKTILETLKGFELQTLFGEYPELQKNIYELSEYWIHAILSFLLLRSDENKSLKEVEDYVRKRFVPGLRLEEHGL